MPQNSVTIAGNLTADPEMRFTPGGAPVAKFTLAYTDRYRDESGIWREGNVSYFDVYAWNDLGEHVAETFQRGNRAIVTGSLQMRTWETKEGEKRRTWDIRADDVGASVRFATARISKASRSKPDRPDDGDPWASASPERPRDGQAPGEPERPADGPGTPAATDAGPQAPASVTGSRGPRRARGKTAA
jgi:single-strand DNA-binding protein